MFLHVRKMRLEKTKCLNSVEKRMQKCDKEN